MNTILTTMGILSLAGSTMLTGGAELMAWRQHTHRINPTIPAVLGSVIIIAGTLMDYSYLRVPGAGLVLVGLLMIGGAAVMIADQQTQSGIPIKGLQMLGAYLMTGALMVILPLSIISAFIGIIIGAK